MKFYSREEIFKIVNKVDFHMSKIAIQEQMIEGTEISKMIFM